MGMTSREKVAAYRARQRAEGRTVHCSIMVTPTEAHYIGRILEQMREEGEVPAMMRDRKGRLKVLDA